MEKLFVSEMISVAARCHAKSRTRTRSTKSVLITKTQVACAVLATLAVLDMENSFISSVTYTARADIFLFAVIGPLVSQCSVDIK